MTQTGLVFWLVISLYKLLGVIVPFIELLTGALPADYVFLDRDIPICFLIVYGCYALVANGSVRSGLA